MLKIRISYVDDEEGNKEIEKIINQLKKNNKILYESKDYESKNKKSIYKRRYLELVVKDYGN